DIIRVNEVNRRIVGDVAQEGSAFFDAKLVPAHVGDFQPGDGGKSDHLAGQQVETGVFAVLKALGKEKLQSQADTEKWLAGLNVFNDGGGQAAFIQLGDGVAESADAG